MLRGCLALRIVKKATSMADPAWPLRSRHARRRMVLDTTVHRILRLFCCVLLPFLLVWRLWIGWFPSTRRLLRDRHVRRRVREAAFIARSALENTVGSAANATNDLLQDVAPRPRAALPLRYFAHMCACLLVSIVVLASSVRLSQAPLSESVSSSFVDATTANQSALQVVSSFSSFSTAIDSSVAIPEVDTAQVFPEAFVTYHQLTDGQTLNDLAGAYKVSVESIVWSNDLQTGELLAVGRELRIPRVSGVPYVVQPGDTVNTIARSLQVTPDAITLFRSNNVINGDNLQPGRELFVPGGVRAYPDEFLKRYGDAREVGAMRAVATGVVREGETNFRSGPSQEHPRLFLLEAGRPLVLVARHADWLKVDAGDDGIGWVRSDLLNLPQGMVDRLPETNDFPPPPPVWVWPTQGRITSAFGYRTRPFRGFHDGLDIANRAGTLIVAARRGTVFEAGWCSGFGYCVKIDHGDGMTTIYGHMLRKPSVRAGDVVEAGSSIGLMGSTYDRRGGGYSTGVHLHFTVKVNGKAVNPARFLP